MFRHVVNSSIVVKTVSLLSPSIKRPVSALRHCIICAVVLAFAVSGPAHSQTLLAHWTGDNTLSDSSGNGNTLTNHGTTFVPWGSHQAFGFNGSSYLSVSPGFDLANDSFTINLWAKLDAFTPGYSGGIPNVFIAQDNGGGFQTKWVMFYDDPSSRFGWLDYQVGGPVLWDYEPPVQTPLNNWVMFTLTGDSSSVAFYENATLLGVMPNYFIAPSFPITLGQAEGLGWLNGEMGNVSLWRGALSQSQVTNLYNGSSATPEASSITLMAAPLLLFGVILMRKRRAAQAAE